MSKRSCKATIESNAPNKQPKKHWSMGLLETMNDPKCVYKESDRLVVIKDKYPKAKLHYLVLPRDKINSIYDLNSTHVSLLVEFGLLAEELKKDNNNAELVAGFHAVPSMHHLHMHVISKDMISPCLKTKVHWNSFTTNYFMPYEEILKMLKEKGFIAKISNETQKELLSTPLKCNQCQFVPKNLPNLKEHLLSHIL